MYSMKSMENSQKIDIARFNELWDKIIEKDVVFIDANNNARKGRAISIWEDADVTRVTVLLANGIRCFPTYDRVGVPE